MRERFRHAQGDGADLVISELVGPRGSTWVLAEERGVADALAPTVLTRGSQARDVIADCAQRLAARQGGHPETWEALIRESVEPSF